MARKSTGKRQRFEIFKRDGFKCQYCGRTPAQDAVLRVLRVDHVDPVVDGGSNDPANLITACFDCNAGKADVALDKLKYQPGFDLDRQKEYLAQLRAYQALQNRIARQKNESLNVLREHWKQHIGPLTKGMDNRLANLVRKWPHEKLLEAMEITGRKLGTPDEEFDNGTALNQQKYFSGVLRAWREEVGGEGPPKNKPSPLPASVVPPPKTKLSWRAERVDRELRKEAMRLEAIGENGIENLREAFRLLAYGSKYDLECSVPWEPDDPDLRIRGLVLRARPAPADKKKLLWAVLDDPDWSVADEMAYAHNSCICDLSLALHQKAEWPVVEKEFRVLTDWFYELLAFLDYQRKWNADGEGPEEVLRRTRTRVGLPNPPRLDS